MNVGGTVRKFARHRVSLAVGLALAASTAVAAPTPLQMPGAGHIVAASFGSAGTNQGGVGTALVNLPSGAGIGIDGKIVIRWGGAGAPPDLVNPAGFNLGVDATMYFGAISAGSAVLNIDASGNASEIMGRLISSTGALAPVAPLNGCGACSFAPSIFLSNANGIVVGPTGRIVVPTVTGSAGVGLIGANLDNPISIADFVGNNTWVAPAAPFYGDSYISFGSVPVTGNITVAGAISGDAGFNLPTRYALIAGNNVAVESTGIVYALRVATFAGLVANDATDAVDGVAGQTVNRIFKVDSATVESCCGVGTVPGLLHVSPTGTGNIVNEGSIVSSGGAADAVLLEAKGNIRSGVAGSSSTSIGIFSDTDVYFDAYSDQSSVSIYNVLGPYSANGIYSLWINRFATNFADLPTVTAFAPSVTIDAVTRASDPSSISTLGAVLVAGGDVTIASTLNALPAAIGGVQGNEDLRIIATGKVTISADVGAGRNLIVEAGDDVTISETLRADNFGASGALRVRNNALGATTTITGNLFVPVTSTQDLILITTGPTFVEGVVLNRGTGDVYIDHGGTGALSISGSVSSKHDAFITTVHAPADNPLRIDGDIRADRNVEITVSGPGTNAVALIDGTVAAGNDLAIDVQGGLDANLVVGGRLSAANNVGIHSDGSASIGEIKVGNSIVTAVDGLQLTLTNTWDAAAAIAILAPLATTRLIPEAVVTAPTIALDVLHFRGTGSDLLPYASEADKPEVQLVTQNLDVMLHGSINAPIAGNTNWPLNSLNVAPLVTLVPVTVSVSANGGGFQAVNLRVLGNTIFDTGTTTTPFIGVPLTTGGFPAGAMQGNLGSQLILQSDGSLILMGTPTGSLLGPPLAVQWPGGAFFSAVTTLQLTAPLYNAWSAESPPFGGVFFSAPVISLQGYIATSGTAWANFSNKPVTGDPTVFQLRMQGANAFGFVATDAFVQNDYFDTVIGLPVCTVLGPTTWTACP